MKKKFVSKGKYNRMRLVWYDFSHCHVWLIAERSNKTWVQRSSESCGLAQLGAAQLRQVAAQLTCVRRSSDSSASAWCMADPGFESRPGNPKETHVLSEIDEGWMNECTLNSITLNCMYKITNKRVASCNQTLYCVFFIQLALQLGCSSFPFFFFLTCELTVANNGPCTVCPAYRQELTYNFFRISVIFGIFSHKSRMRSSLQWLERLTANATVLGSIPASVGTVESDWRQMKQC